MWKFIVGLAAVLTLIVVAAGCDALTDAATRLAYDIEAGAARLGKEDGATDSIQHSTPSKPGKCVGPHHVQMDKVGALIIWCKDDGGRAVVTEVR